MSAEEQLERINKMLVNVVGLDVVGLTTVEAVRRLIAEFERLDERQPSHPALQALDRLTRRCADGEVTIERASGPSDYDDAALVTFLRARGNAELEVTVDGRGRTHASLSDGKGSRYTLARAPDGASIGLLWLGQVFAGEIEPERR